MGEPVSGRDTSSDGQWLMQAAALIQVLQREIAELNGEVTRFKAASPSPDSSAAQETARA